MEHTKTQSIPPMRYLRQYAQELHEQGLSEWTIFYRLTAEFTGTPYRWGGATTEASDCSGTVCAALNALYGRERRVTTDELFRRFFTMPYTESESIHALFFLNKARRAVHVSAYMGNGIYLNESSREPHTCGTPRTYAELCRMYSDFLAVRRTYRAGAWE